MIHPHRLACLAPNHDVSRFSCGEDSLDRYLQNEAHAAQASGEARTHVWLDQSDRIAAYFTIMPTMVTATEMPSRVRLGARKQIPGYLIAKLALDRPLRRQGLGPDLLVDALTTIVRAADAAGGRVIVVDSLEDNKVHGFYTSLNFNPLPGSYRLWMSVSTAREALADV